MLGGVLVVGDAVLDPLRGRIPEIDQERHHREDKHAEDLLEILDKLYRQDSRWSNV